MDTYTHFVFDDCLVSPVNEYKAKKITTQNIKQFGFNSIEDLNTQYPGFPLTCKNTILKYKIAYDNNISDRIYLQNLAEYDKNPLKCKREECPNHLSYKQKKTRNKFCSSSCSAMVNNKGKINNPKGIGLNHEPKKNKKVKIKVVKEKRIKLPKLPNPKIIKVQEYPRMTNYLKISIENILGRNYIDREDINLIKNVIIQHINDDLMTPNEIKQMYNLPYQNIHDLISSVLKIPTRTLLEAQKILRERRKDNLDEKSIYYLECRFSFDVYKYPKIIGYDLLQRYRFIPPDISYIDRMKEIFLHRDHMISISYGWKNNIPSEIISHPANCHIMFEKDNISKGDGISITLEELKERIEKWDDDISYIPEQMILQPNRLPKSEEHKEKIRQKNIGKKTYNDGIKNHIVFAGENPEPHWVLGTLKSLKRTK